MEKFNVYIVATVIVTIGLFVIATDFTSHNQPIPDWLIVAIGMAISFFFGAKAAQNGNGK